MTDESGVRSVTVAVIIVTYDSAPVLERCLAALAGQTRQPDLIVIVDNCSPDAGYLESLPQSPRVRLLRSPRNEGFSQGNNRGYALARHCDYVIFLNPDAFATEDLIDRALSWMQQPGNGRVGCVTGTLLGFDVAAGQPTGLVDSTGIFQTRAGRWYDRGKGQRLIPQESGTTPQDVPAICGALMICRTAALEQAALGPCEVFDSRFFMYKEDIDLSLRLRRRGWRLTYVPTLACYHGRGWQGRAVASYRSRYLSARNELRVCLRNRLRGLPYTLLKFVYVTCVERFRLDRRKAPARS